MKSDREKKSEESTTLNDKAWDALFEKYHIMEEVEQKGIFYINATQIKEFREPRLMTKFDTRESLPKAFGKGKAKKMSILPDSRGSYVIGYFDTYLEFPEMEQRIKQVDFPDYLQTISKSNINSEANVINVLGVTQILEDFLNEPQFAQTISGRMKSGIFDFKIQDNRFNEFQEISVRNAQIEIDAGFENHNCICLMEAKNVVHKDFIVRQLYYPYRLWKDKVTKPIRTVFMVYSNNVLRLMEYEFAEMNCYSSIQFLRQKNYSFEDVGITLEDLMDVYRNTLKCEEPQDVPFLQADSFPTVISLMEIVQKEPMTTTQLAQVIGFAPRQGDYYYNAAKYLGLTYKEVGEDGMRVVSLSSLGREVLALPYKQRQLKYIELMLQHEIFRVTFFASATTSIVDKHFIAKEIRELGLCGESLVERRASTVLSWLRWIFATIND